MKTGSGVSVSTTVRCQHPTRRLRDAYHGFAKPEIVTALLRSSGPAKKRETVGIFEILED